MSLRILCVLISVVVGFAECSLILTAANAQPPGAARPPRAIDPAAEDPQRRQTLKLIFDCEEALAEGRHLAAAELFDSAWGLAVQREDPLLTLSSDATDQLKPGEHRTQAGARVRLERIYESASNEFRDQYAEYVSVAVGKAEVEAIRGGRTEELERFTVRYQFTPQAQQALRRLIHLRLARGEFLQAALQYGRLLRLEKDERLESRVRLAVFWWKAQLPEEAVDYLRDAVRGGDGDVVTLAGRERLLPAKESSTGELLKWLATIEGQPSNMPHATAGEPVEWLQPRGNYRRTALQPVLPALLHDVWSHDLSESVLHPQISDFLAPLMTQMSQRSGRELRLRRAAIPAGQPLAVDGKVIFQTLASVMAVSLESGELLWETSNADIQLRKAVAMLRAGGSGNVPVEFVQRQIEDDLFHHTIQAHGAGQLTSDGRRLYVVEDSSAETMTDIDRSGPSRGPAFNYLRAYDLASGNLLGQAGGESGIGGRVNPMAGMYFLGAPLVMGERIYVMAENDQGIFLIELRLRPMFGRTRLAEVDLSPVRSQLLTIPRAPLRRHPARRLAGIIPSYSRGLLVCGTCDERVVAVSAEDHSVRWIYRYGSNVAVPEGARDLFTFGSVRGGDLSRSLDLESRWLDTLPKISDGRVFLTPRDSDRLFCLDLQTGRELWSRVRGSLREIVSLDKDRIVLAGADSVEAVRASSGERLWQTDINTFVSGRCAVSDGLVHVPCVDRSVMTLDVRDGRRLVTQSTGDHRPGNLLSVGDALLSRNISELVALRTPADAAGSGLARANRAFFRNDRDAAESALREALNDESLHIEERFSARRQLIEILLERLRKDFAGNADLLPVVHKLFDEASATDRQIEDFVAGIIGLTPGQLQKLPERWQQLDALEPLRDELIRIETAGTLSDPQASAEQTADTIWKYLNAAERGALRDSGHPSLSQSPVVQAAAEIRKALLDRPDSVRREIGDSLAERMIEHAKADSTPQAVAEMVTSMLLCSLGDSARAAIVRDSTVSAGLADASTLDRILAEMPAAATSRDARDSVSELLTVWRESDRTDLEFELIARSKRLQVGERVVGDVVSVSLSDRFAVAAELLPTDGDRVDGAAFSATVPWQGIPKVIPSAAHSAQKTHPGRVRANSPQWNIPLLGHPGAFAGWSFTQQPGSPLVVAHDRHGRQRWTFNRGVIGNRSGAGRQLSSFYAVAWSSVLVLKLNDDVYVLNTLQLTESGSPKLLWQLPVPRPRSSPPMWQSTQQYDVQPSGLTPVGPLSAIGIPILINRAVTMYDLFSGLPLWRVSGLRQDVTLSADGEHLCLISASQGEVQVRQLHDGELVTNHPIPPWWIEATENSSASIRDFELEPNEEQRWRITVLNNECLLLKRTTESSALESFDLAANHVRWSIELPTDSVVSNPVDGHVAVLSNGTQLQVFDVVSGIRRTSLTVSAAPKSRNLYLRPSRDRWVVLTDVGDVEWDWVPISDSVTVNGFAWGIDSSSGRLVWEQPVQRESLRILTPTRGIPAVPDVVPVLLLLKRPQGPPRPNGLMGAANYQARMLDTRTGTIIFEDNDLGLNLSWHGVELKPAQDVIEFAFNKRNIVLDYSAGSEGDE